VVSATPIVGVIYNHETQRVAAEIPGRPYTDLRGGCPPGYRSASVLLAHENEGEPTFGFYVVFN
jgi:hypothetical protein